MTYAEYLELERTSPAEKHEFLRGEVWAMAGCTPTHSLIAAYPPGRGLQPYR